MIRFTRIEVDTVEELEHAKRLLDQDHADSTKTVLRTEVQLPVSTEESAMSPRNKGKKYLPVPLEDRKRRMSGLTQDDVYALLKKQPCAMGELEELLNIDRSYLYRFLYNLRTKGLIWKRDDARWYATGEKKTAAGESA